MIKNIRHRYLSQRTYSIDCPSSYSLTKTKYPLSKVTLKAYQQHSITPFLQSSLNQTQAAHSSSNGNKQVYAQIWRNKYECAIRDNELLKNQIDYLNVHINQLSRDKKKVEDQIDKLLKMISKTFMQKIVECQKTIFKSLTQQQFRIEILWRKAQRAKDKIPKRLQIVSLHNQISQSDKRPKELLQFNSFQLYFSNNERPANNVIKKYEKSQPNSNDWGNLFMPFADGCQNALVDKLFSFTHSASKFLDHKTCKNQSA